MTTAESVTFDFARLIHENQGGAIVTFSRRLSTGRPVDLPGDKSEGFRSKMTSNLSLEAYF